MAMNNERGYLAGHAGPVAWMVAQDGLLMGVNEDHPDQAKHYITMKAGGIPLVEVDEDRVRRLCSGLYPLEAYLLRFILQHPACTLGDALFAKGIEGKPDSITPKQMSEAAEKLMAEGRIHLTRRWVADAISPREKEEQDEMQSLEGQEYLRGMQETNPEQVKKWEQEGLVKRVPSPPHEPPASGR